MASLATARIEARVQPEIHQIIKHAAQISGRSVSDFVVTAATQLAKQTIEENHVIELSLKDQQDFAKNILNPPPMNEAMRQAFILHDQLISKE